MNRHLLRRSLYSGLTWGVVATLVLPVVLAVLVGLGGLLRSLGDVPGAVVCGRVALAIGTVWITAVVVTTAATAVAVLDSPPPDRPGGRGRRRRFRPRAGRSSVERPGVERSRIERRPLHTEPPERPS